MEWARSEASLLLSTYTKPGDHQTLHSDICTTISHNFLRNNFYHLKTTPKIASSNLPPGAEQIRLPRPPKNQGSIALISYPILAHDIIIPENLLSTSAYSTNFHSQPNPPANDQAPEQQCIRELEYHGAGAENQVSQASCRGGFKNS